MDKIGCEMTCKNHSARSERDQYRICPTKLSKSELENLYFALLENNLQLKKTINVQEDKIKVLSTKLQRITSAQNVLRAEENKSCCVATKVVVNQQKEMIAELKRGNERMADRVRKLNMRLCSAKQFCKSATPRGLRCSTATSPYLIKHSPCSYKQQSHSTLKLAVSCQNLSRDSLVTKYVQTEPWESIRHEDEDKPCEDNKCKTLMDEFEDKIFELQKKLSESQEARDAEGQRSRIARAAAERDLERAENNNVLLTSNLRTAEGLACELKMQLSIEKRRVVELETRLKAATMSNKVNKNIEDTLNSIQSNKTTGNEITFTCTCCSPRSKLESSSQQTYIGLSPNNGVYNESKLSKSTDDSGYMDTNKSQAYLDDQSLNKIIEELTKRILVLQTQVDAMTISPPETDKLETKVETSITNKRNESKAIEHSTPKRNSIQQTTISENNDDEVQLTGTESETENEKDLNTSDAKSYEETSQIDHWNQNISKLKLITDKTRDNGTTGNEITESKNISEENKRNSVVTKQNSNNVKENDRLSEKNINSIIKSNETLDRTIKDKELSTEPEDKSYNTSAKYGTDVHEDTIKTHAFIKHDKTIKKIGSQERTDTKSNIDSPRRFNKSSGSGLKKHKVKRQSTVKEIPIHIDKEPVVEKTLGRRDTGGKGSTCEEATYTVEHDDTCAPSADNTDDEISSMTDLSEEGETKSPLKSLSPGERKYSTPHSDSFITQSTNYSLSEGEIVTSVRRRSCDDKQRTELGAMTTAPKMEETLQAITDELARCKRLLLTQRSYDNTKSVLVKM